jgi:nicotinamidase-related amidase
MQCSNDAIIVVDFLTDVVGKVLPEIWEAIGVYPFAAYITKERYDGSENILKVCRKRGFYYGAIEICGIHSEVCVALTARGLIAQGVRVTIHKSAVADLYGEPLSWTKSEQGLFLCVVD